MIKPCYKCYELLESLKRPGRFMLPKMYDDNNLDELKNHLQSEEFSIVRGAMSLLANKPEISVYVVTSRQVLDPLQKKGVLEKRNNPVVRS